MKDNRIKKSAASTVGLSTPDDGELRLINSYARREMKADEVYVFPVVLCDNDVDRDGERFPVESLFALEKLFVGKTGIFDHDPSAKNQAARIISCAVESVPGKVTATGDDYFRLCARAYLPRSEGNAGLIEALDSGILREVSVGCAVGEVRCSVCGEPLHSCSHKSGETYGGKLCCGELCDPYDAYEWSFVAVPAQKNAGVTKSFGKERNMEDLMKSLDSGREVTLTAAECKKLAEYVQKLRHSAADGVYYRETLSADVLRLSAAVQPDISRETMESVMKGMTVAQLREFRSAFEKQRAAKIGTAPQLYREKNKGADGKNGAFQI